MKTVHRQYIIIVVGNGRRIFENLRIYIVGRFGALGIVKSRTSIGVFAKGFYHHPVVVISDDGIWFLIAVEQLNLII